MYRSSQSTLPAGLRPATAEAWSQRVGVYSALPGLIRQLGGDPVAMLASAGLAPDALDRPENRIPYEALGRLLRESAIRTRCAHLGLLVGRMCHLADLGLLGELVRNRATVGEALQSLVVHQHMNSGGGLAFLVERGGMVDLGYAIYHPGVTGTNQVYDSVLAAAFNFLRELCGTGYLPSEVFFPYSKPVDTTHYRNLFKVQPRFNAEFCALRFPAYWMERPVAGCDPERLRLAQERVANADPDRLIQQVYRALRVLLLQGKKSGDDLARMLSMHRRTLNRRLSGEGTTFQKVLDAVRFEVARQLLANSEVALDDVAATLGYAGVSPFMRSFRRWAGTTPGQWRRAAMVDPPGDGASDYRLRFRPGLTGDAATRVPPASVS